MTKNGRNGSQKIFICTEPTTLSAVQFSSCWERSISLLIMSECFRYLQPKLSLVILYWILAIFLFFTESGNKFLLERGLPPQYLRTESKSQVALNVAGGGMNDSQYYVHKSRNCCYISLVWNDLPFLVLHHGSSHRFIRMEIILSSK